MFAALVLAALGAFASTSAAVWLLVGFRSTNPRYVEDGLLYPGAQVSKVVPNLLHDQRRVAALVVIGSMLQLAGAVLALL